MGRSIFAFIGLLLSIWVSAASAQVTFVGAADLGNNGGTNTSLSGSVTASGKSNEMLLVCLYDNSGTSDGSNETMTYNGLSMTYVAATQGVSPAWIISLWYILNPTSGAHTLAYSRSSGVADFIQMAVVDYQGVQQFGQTDNAGTNQDSINEVTFSSTTSTLTDGAGLIGCAFNGGQTLTPSTSGSYTARLIPAGNDMVIADATPIIPHGNVTFTATITDSGSKQQQSWISFLPAVGGLLLRGVGP